MSSQRVFGTIKWFNAARGLGFIFQQNGAEVFVHYSQIRRDGFKTLEQGQLVSFELCSGAKGFYAQNVQVVTEQSEVAQALRAS